MGAGHAVTALYEIRLNGESRRGLGSVIVRYKDAASGRVSEVVAAIARRAANDLDALPAHREFLDMVELAMRVQGKR